MKKNIKLIIGSVGLSVVTMVSVGAEVSSYALKTGEPRVEQNYVVESCADTEVCSSTEKYVIEGISSFTDVSNKEQVGLLDNSTYTGIIPFKSVLPTELAVTTIVDNSFMTELLTKEVCLKKQTVSVTDVPVTKKDSACTVTTTEAIKSTTSVAIETASAKSIKMLPKYKCGNVEKQFMAAINQHRAQNSLNPLLLNNELSALAYVRASESVKVWSHVRPDGRNFRTIFDDYGIAMNPDVCENIVISNDDGALHLLALWTNDESYNKNLMSDSYTEIGIAEYYKNGKSYICVIFS